MELHENGEGDVRHRYSVEQLRPTTAAYLRLVFWMGASFHLDSRFMEIPTGADTVGVFSIFKNVQDHLAEFPKMRQKIHECLGRVLSCS